jgi:dTDP-4-amino-4,6-dideoxygalactose transaminase
MQVPFVDLGVQYRAIKDELEVEFQKVFAKTAFIMGPAVKEFEEDFAQYCGVKHAIGVGNGTDAITLTLKALGIGPGNKVVTAANTFIATVEGIVNAGATPVLVDVDPKTYNIDPIKLKELITDVKAIIPVHLFGQPADMDPILEIAADHDLLVMEDACQAHGAKYGVNGQLSAVGGRKVGAFGDAACFSFYPAKNLGAYGDGGMVVTNDDEVAQTIGKLRDHGSSQKYQHDMVGYDSRLDTLQAAVLLTKLRYLDEWNEMRRRNAKIYDELLGEIDGVVPPGPGVLDKATPVYHLYVIYLEKGNRDELQQYLQEKGIGTGIHYPTPVHLSKAFEYLGYKEGDFPVTEDRAKKILSLPMFPELTREQIEYVASQIKAFMKQL